MRENDRIKIINQQNNHKNQKSILIKAVGDIAPGDSSVSGLGVFSLTKRYGSDYVFQILGSVLNHSDLLLGNLEGVLSEQVLTNDLRLCGLPDMAKVLHQAGFEILSVANNHIFDHGKEIFEETISHCEIAGIKICGLRGSSDYYSQPVIIKKKSTTIGVLAYNWIGLENSGEMGKYIAIVEDGVVNYTWNRDRSRDQKAQKLVHQKNGKVIRDIKRLREEVDILVLMSHWGYEWTIYPPYGVTLEAHTFIEAGVDLIIGSHPHVIQGVKRHGKGLIAYSLGNFLFDACTDEFNPGMILECRIAPGYVENYSCKFVKRSKCFQPEPVSSEDEKRSLSLVEMSNTVLSSENAKEKLDDDLLYKEFEKQYNKLKQQKIVYLLKNIPKHPFLLKQVLKKILNLFYLILYRLKGKKVRW